MIQVLQDISICSYGQNKNIFEEFIISADCDRNLGSKIVGNKF